ncbi:MAG: hypothetical protein HZB55_17280 [Deltaproteobacteria bacterium]|nr:hypothetical protein [Deltaproteobacteria bacterium]
MKGTVERPWQSTEEALGRFGEKKGEARRRYEEFVGAGVARGRRPELVGGGLQRSAGAGREFTRRERRGEEDDVYDERILGSSTFVSSVLREAQGEEREVRRRALRGVGLEELARRVPS